MANPKWKEWTEPSKLILLQGWAMDGLTDEQIAKNMGISVATLYNWQRNLKKDDPKLEIFNAIKKGKEVADYEVENALFKAACGFHYDEEVVEVENGIITGRKVYTRYQAPSVTAQIFWLKNRRRDKWKDKIETEQNVQEKVSIVFDTDAEEYGD